MDDCFQLPTAMGMGKDDRAKLRAIKAAQPGGAGKGRFDRRQRPAEWSHLNFLVSTPLVNSADPRDRRMEYRYRDLVALALMASQAFAGERPWGHPEVARMLDRGIAMERKREELSKARERLKRILPKVPSVLRPFLALALEPGLWPEEGPTFAAYLQARPFETRCDALVTLDVGALFAEACK